MLAMTVLHHFGQNLHDNPHLSISTLSDLFFKLLSAFLLYCKYFSTRLVDKYF